MDHSVILYQQRFNLQNAVFSRIEHEDAMVAIVYKITQRNGKPLILKVCERVNDYLRELYFLKHLDGRLPVPRIIDVIQPEVGLNGAILMEFLSGTLLPPSELADRLAYEVGSQLAGIHLNRMTGYGDPVQGDLNPDPRIYFTLKFEEGLNECCHHLPKVLIEQCDHYYHDHLELLTSVDGPCMVHRDFRPGNLIIDNGKLQGIIDWAGARASFAEEDFCPLEHGEWPNNPNMRKFFQAGYASIRPVPDYKHILPLLRLSKAIAVIGFTVKSGTWDNSHARVYRFNRHYLDHFFETV